MLIYNCCLYNNNFNLSNKSILIYHYYAFFKPQTGKINSEKSDFSSVTTAFCLFLVCVAI